MPVGSGEIFLYTTFSIGSSQPSFLPGRPALDRGVPLHSSGTSTNACETSGATSLGLLTLSMSVCCWTLWLCVRLRWSRNAHHRGCIILSDSSLGRNLVGWHVLEHAVSDHREAT